MASLPAGCPGSRFLQSSLVGHDHRWGLFMTCWRDLRAQLHGVVIPPGEVGGELAHREFAEGLNRKAPTLAP